MPKYGFNINNFKAELHKGGLIHTTDFRVDISPPTGLSQAALGFISTVDDTSGVAHMDSAQQIRTLSFQCRGTELPPLALLTTDANRYGYGPMEKMAHTTEFGPITLKFYLDAKFAGYNFFQTWFKLCHNWDLRKGLMNATGVSPGQMPYELTYKSEYASPDITINVFNRKGKIVKKYHLMEAFPTALGSIPMDWELINNVANYFVEFTYLSWYAEDYVVSPTNVVNPAGVISVRG